MNKIIVPILLLNMFCCSPPENAKLTSSENKVKVIGHRGFGGLYPENSLLSIKKALEIGVDRIEIDVQQSQDEVVVVMHDTSLDRTTNGQGKIKDFTFAALKKLHIDYPLGVQGDTLRIPSLEEVLQQIKGQTTLIIEIKKGKRYYPNMEANVIALINQYQAAEWCIIHSFEDEVLEEVHRLQPSIKLHKLLLTSFLYDFDKMDFIEEFSINYHFSSERLIQKLHAKNKKLNVWTVNEEANMKKAIDIGVDGIITDRPDILQTLIK